MSNPIPSPQITGISEGGYISVCPECDAQIPIVVTDVPILKDMVDTLDATISVVVGHTTDFDLSAFNTHFTTEHPS